MSYQKRFFQKEFYSKRITKLLSYNINPILIIFIKVDNTMAITGCCNNHLKFLVR